jgi:hypothetical protein
MAGNRGIALTKTPARFARVMLSALSTGVLFGTKVSLGPSAKDFTPGTYVEVQQATIRNLRPVMGTLLPGAVMATPWSWSCLGRSDRWNTVHTIRTASSVAGLGCLVGAALACTGRTERLGVSVMVPQPAA